MDRSVDSIGSCSLDVDADSSEMSDASSSFLTPLSTKDLTREFTSQILDRCPMKPKNQNLVTVVDPVKGDCGIKTINIQTGCDNNEFKVVPSETSQGKKPSYLNLACCVNGYSSITTYDSKIRQDINKSREVSPIRPSTTGFQYCKKNNALAPPLPVVMSTRNTSNLSLDSKLAKGQSGIVKCIETNNNCNRNGHSEKQSNASGSAVRNSGDYKSCTSFIQQRVERLYGPGALAQGFYSPKKVKANSGDRLENAEKIDFNRKFKQLSTCSDFKESTKKGFDISQCQKYDSYTNENDKHKNKAIDLPVLRHLSQEFRAQLPSISPKRSILRNSSAGCSEESSESANEKNLTPTSDQTLSDLSTVKDEVDHKDNNKSDIDISLTLSKVPDTTAEIGMISEASGESLHNPIAANKSIEKKKDGTYFLILLKNEQDRLLLLANRAEKYIDMLSNNPEVSEDVLGILRSASGKARLLVSQKMKQFEGLCHNNLNRATEDKFPTTVEDLQGFWDMVNLQVDNIDSTYEEIESLKKNNWKIATDEVPVETNKPQIVIKKNNLKLKSMSIGVNSVSKTTSALSATALRREAQRKQLMELKRKHKMAMTGSSTASVADGLQSSSLKTSDISVKDNCS